MRRPKVRMPNQSSAPEKPRGSVSISSTARRHSGRSSGIRMRRRGSAMAVMAKAITSANVRGQLLRPASRGRR